MNPIDMTPLLQEMLHEMRMHLSADDIRAGLPEVDGSLADVSLLYAEWTSLCDTEQRQMERIAELDSDIARMEPWGDYPMARIDQFSQQGRSLRFWRCTQTQYEGHWPQWSEKFGADLISQRDGFCYFTTVTPIDVMLAIPEAHSVEVTPSPVSTLIVLQTRAKDSLRQVQLQMGDFSLQHYREVEAALGLTDTIQIPSRRHRLMRTVQRLFSKIKR
ncbi:MAG: hypothetical protein J6W69_06795 [Bacteroidales bacterium]|nr:hypothetical protein [Bacteroidales bacterium]